MPASSSQQVTDNSQQVTDNSQQVTDNSQQVTDNSQQVTDNSQQVTDNSQQAVVRSGYLVHLKLYIRLTSTGTEMTCPLSRITSTNFLPLCRSIFELEGIS